MPRLLRYLAIPAILLCAASASAQPTITNITPAFGGGGSNSFEVFGNFAITGTGFSTVRKAIRFVDASNADVLIDVNCTSATSCTAIRVRSFRVVKGATANLQVFALRTDTGLKSATGFAFLYYGAPVVTRVAPDTGPYNVSTGYALNGGPWTNGGTFPGTTSVDLFSSSFRGICASASVCNLSAPPPGGDCCAAQGAYRIDIHTDGGSTTAYFLYSETPATPTITGVSPTSGAPGTLVTVSGSNFIPGGTQFAFTSRYSLLSSPATSVSCSTTKCTMTAPNLGTADINGGGPADIRVVTTCPPSSAFCGGSNTRLSNSLPVTKTNAFTYAQIKVSSDTAIGILSTSTNGGSAAYQVSLYSQPTDFVNVYVSLSGGGGGELVSPLTLTFTPQNWAVPQTVTLTGTANTLTNKYTIRNVANSPDLNFNLVERDTTVYNLDGKGYVMNPSGGLVTTRAGGTATFTVALSAAPSAAVTVSLVSNDPLVGTVSPSTITFATTTGGATGWNVARTVTVTGLDDGWPGTDRDYSIIATAVSDDPTYGNANVLVPFDTGVTNVDAALPPPGLSLARTGPGAAVANWTTVATAYYYNIKYSTTPGGAKTLLASSVSPGPALTGLTIGQQYYFVVSSIGAGGEGADSAELPFKEYPPGAVGGFDGDLKSDMTYVTPAGVWHMLNSTAGFGSESTVSLGGAGYTPVSGDYDGDQRQDVAVYNTATGAWNILTSSSNYASGLNISWGGAGYIPVPGDYDGDGRTDPAVYRLSDGQWSALLSSTNYTTTISKGWGGGGYTPVPGLDFDGDGKADLTIYSQATGTWYVLKSSANYMTTFTKAWGGRGYTLVPGDYDGDGKADLGLYQRSTGTWSILLSGGGSYSTAINVSWGGVGYLPIPGDFDGDGKTDLGVFQQATGNWFALLSTTNYTTTVSASGWGTSGDRILSSAIFVGGDDASRASDFDADGKAELTVYNTTSGAWSSLTSSSSYASALNKNFGGTGYTAVPGDYDGDGKVDYAVYQTATGNWSVLLSSTNFTTSLTKSAGGVGWIPVPGDYDGDGKTDFAAYNTTTGQWFGLKSSSNYTTTVSIGYGGTGYTAVPADFDGDGKTDIAVYQGSTGNWSVLLSSTNYTTSLSKSVGGAGYVPVQADYDADGKADFVVYNTTSGLWYGLKSSSNYTTTVNVSWGGGAYTPVKGDFDGDGRADLAVYQSSSGNFYILLSGTNYTTTLSKALGGAGYVALPAYP